MIVSLSLVDAVRRFQWRGPVSFACRKDAGHPLPRVRVVLTDEELGHGPCAVECPRCGDRRLVTWRMAGMIQRIVEHDWSLGWVRTYGRNG